MQRLRFVDLFAGLGGFHRALTELGHQCVFASEIDDELRELYVRNFPEMKGQVFGDIRHAKALIPKHDVLCAGFPCQPFSKSGSQLGTRDETFGNDAIVLYAAPAVENVNELVALKKKSAILSNSNFRRARELNGHHRNTYVAAGT